MRKYFSKRKVPPNVWLGTSVENKRHGVPRIDELRKIKAKVRFFFKQWGAWGEDGVRRNKKANGRIYNGRHWDQMPVGFHF